MLPRSLSRRRGTHKRQLGVVRDASSDVARWLARQEGAVVAAVLGLLVALFGFVKIAHELLEGELSSFDEWLLRLPRLPDNPRIPIGPSWLLESAKDMTVLGGRTFLVAVILFSLGYLALERKRGAMWLVAVAAVGGGLFSTVMKELFGRGRPDIVPHLVVVASPSFPSGHAMLAAIIYLTLGALLARFTARRRTRAYLLSVAVLLTLVVGASRVYLGVHYPTDVLAGWCAGLVWALICWLVARYLQYRGAVERPGKA
jgi:undecaprenyl-diphosphatase